MYLTYWKLQEKPFENTPDPRFLFHSAQHEEALMRMLYAVRERKGAGLLTGEYGCGKTLLSRVLVKEVMADPAFALALITNPRMTALDLLKEIVYQLGIDQPPVDKPALLRALNEQLFANFQANKHSVIIIDEAQTITDPVVLDEVRLLLNFQTNDRFLLTLVFLGQPELRETLEQLPQLRQRFGIRYHLKGLTEEETVAYVRHRLRVAGGVETVFDEGAFPVIYRFSQGSPRRINNICDLALLFGFGQKVSAIDGALMEQIVLDFEGANQHGAAR
ncbi:MAG: AAA family ATPase [Candidatus Omnitrophica bacterium]|nr:AAA family ATPase [Candidatus Omnitrophota bacterium]